MTTPCYITIKILIFCGIKTFIPKSKRNQNVSLLINKIVWIIIQNLNVIGYFNTDSWKHINSRNLIYFDRDLYPKCFLGKTTNPYKTTRQSLDFSIDIVAIKEIVRPSKKIPCVFPSIFSFFFLQKIPEILREIKTFWHEILNSFWRLLKNFKAHFWTRNIWLFLVKKKRVILIHVRYKNGKRFM